MARKRGLGQGISALISDEFEDEIALEHRKDIVNVKISLVAPNKDQPRRIFDEDALEELADSIKQFGVLQPLVVVKRDKFYEIIAGERRWRAAKLAKLEQVPVIVKEFTEEEVVEVSLIENIQRENLNPIEEAIAFQRLIEVFNLKQDEIAEKVSKSRTAITNTLRLLKLDNRVKDLLIEEKISGGHARALLAIKENPDLQYETALMVFDKELSVRDTEKYIKKLLKGDGKTKVKKEVDPNIAAVYNELQQKIEEIIGTKVLISANDKNKGKIEIEFFSSNELERIIELIESIKTE